MNVQVLGDDICYGADSMWDSLSKSVTGFFTSDTGKVVTAAVTSYVGQKLKPTQKAQLAHNLEAAGITALPQSWKSWTTLPVPLIPQKDNIVPYLIIGGAVLVGLVVMLGTRHRR